MGDKLYRLTEAHANQLYKPFSGEREQFPRAWATFTIDMTLLDAEQRKKVFIASHLLHEVGVRFDSGSGCGGHDWELDWSLTGALLKVRPIHCMNGDCGKRMTRGKAHWAVLRRESDGWTPSYAFCSPRCRDQYVSESGMTVLMTATQEVGLDGEPFWAPWLRRLHRWYLRKWGRQPIGETKAAECTPDAEGG